MMNTTNYSQNYSHFSTLQDDLEPGSQPLPYHWSSENECYPRCNPTTTPDPTYHTTPHHNPTSQPDNKRRKLSHTQEVRFEQITTSSGWMDCSYENLQTHGYATGHEPFWDTNVPGTLQASYLEDLLQNDLVSAF